MFQAVPRQVLTSQSEMRDFSAFIRELSNQVWAHHQPSAPNMYHYTNAAGFHGIVEASSIHATHIAFMNDAEEYKHAVQMLWKVLDSEHNGLTEAQERIVRVMKDNLRRTEPANYYPVFVACFSMLDDDLSQWRAYGGQNAGFNIGVNINHMVHFARQWAETYDFVGYVMAAIYDEAEKIELVTTVANYVLSRYPVHEANQQAVNKEEYAQHWVTDFFSLASLLAPLMKHDKFKAEAEWRLVLTPLKTEHVHFRPKQGLISPYVKVGLKGQTFEGFDHPYRKVVVGPTRYGALNHLAAMSILSLKGHAGIEVGVSSIPYRDVS
jgi:hypothetical protein